MKTEKPDLDVDFIGGNSPLTAEEEKALSEFFKQRKSDLTKKETQRRHHCGKNANSSSLK